MPVPTVSIVLPTLGEREHIRDCLDSLLAQDHPGILEILVCDGGSTDGTREIVASVGEPVRLLDNPGVTAAAGMNVGIRAARGEIVCRADAHTLYARDYVARCVEVLLETGATNVGGRMVPVGTTQFGRAVAAVTTSPLGVGPGRFHYSTEREEVDTVYLGCWHRATLEALDGYAETDLQWAAEDQELNLRIHQAGGTVVLDPTIRSWYFPRDAVRPLARQYANYGMAKASTLRKHGRLPTWRPLAPAMLVVGTAAGLLLGRGATRIAIPAAHTAVVVAAATRLAAAPGVAPHRAIAATMVCHWSYGFGFLRGLGRILLGRPFDQRPRRGR